MITAPGVYDISAEDYHADPCPEPSLSSSIAKMLVTPGTTPLHAFTECPRLNPNYEREDDEKFDLGRAAHSLILRDPQAFEIIDAPDWRTKQAKDQREAARECGKIPLLVEQFERCTEMVVAARVQLDRHEEAFAAFTDGRAEQTLIWREGEIWCRARLDWLPNRWSGVNEKFGSSIFPDYKSTAASADPDLWSRTMYGMGADIQAAFYMRGIKALGLCKRPLFRFVVQENYRPFALSVIGLAPGALDLADRECAKAIHAWTECRRANRWPGYPSKTCFIDAPAWHEAAIMAREDRAAAISPAALQRGAEAQRPI